MQQPVVAVLLLSTQSGILKEIRWIVSGLTNSSLQFDLSRFFQVPQLDQGLFLANRKDIGVYYSFTPEKFDQTNKLINKFDG